MKFVPASTVKDAMVVVMDRHHDDRGFFQEIYEEDNYYHGLDTPWLDANKRIRWQQSNWSVSNKNVLRGIHVAPYAKLVTCVSGRIWDVVVDCRSKSPTFLKHFAIELHPGEPKQVYVPPGCGHAFLALEDNSSVIYMQSGRYAKEGEIPVIYNEPNLNIPWPGENYILSERDREAGALWSMQLCIDEEIDYFVNDQLQKVWIESRPPEEQEEWRQKFGDK